MRLFILKKRICKKFVYAIKTVLGTAIPGTKLLYFLTASDKEYKLKTPSDQIKYIYTFI